MAGNRKGPPPQEAPPKFISSDADRDQSTRQLRLGEELRDEGTTAARAATTPLVRHAIDRAIATLAETRCAPWSAVDVHALLALEGIDLARQPLSGSPNALGGAFRKALKDGMIVCVGVAVSSRPSRRGGLVRTYLSAEHAEAGGDRS